MATAQLDYVHFSLQLNTERRLAWWVAWNIDGRRLFSADGIHRVDFRADDRLSDELQTLNDLYLDNHLDRGHIARRADLLWGTLPEALAGNRDSFFYTNITPQMRDFNQSRRDGVWGLLENAVLELDKIESRRVTLFGGPVLAASDPVYRGRQIPKDHWKVVAYAVGGQVQFRCFVLSQDLNPDRIETMDYLDEFKTHQVTLTDLEMRTGLQFESLRSHDDGLLARALEGGRVVADARDVEW
nr:DNA/RNA non-specific endonuclease [Nocardioides coralli]